MYALVEGRRLAVDIADSLDGNRWLLFVGSIKDGVDWRVRCKRLESLLLEDSVQETHLYSRRNSPFRLSVAADYIEDYPTSVGLVYRWGNKTLPPTAEFLALVLRSVVE